MTLIIKGFYSVCTFGHMLTDLYQTYLLAPSLQVSTYITPMTDKNNFQTLSLVLQIFHEEE